MAPSLRNKLLLAGIILAGLALLSIQLPSLTPWFVGWLLAGTGLSFAYKRRQPGLIALSFAAVLALLALGLYPRWQTSVATVSSATSLTQAVWLTEHLKAHTKATGGQVPGVDHAIWQSLEARLDAGVTVETVALPHRAALVTAAESLSTDPEKANQLTVFLAEDRFFVIVPRDAAGVPAAFSEDLSNLKQGNHSPGEVRAVDVNIQGNQGAEAGY